MSKPPPSSSTSSSRPGGPSAAASQAPRRHSPGPVYDLKPPGWRPPLSANADLGTLLPPGVLATSSSRADRSLSAPLCSFALSLGRSSLQATRTSSPTVLDTGRMRTNLRNPLSEVDTSQNGA